MAHWTNLERRRLIEVHKGDHPSVAELTEMFPRHTISSILTTISDLGIRRNSRRIQWLRLCHEYFAKREAEMRAS